MPQGAEDQIDVATLTFEIPIWLSPPAKVKKLGVIRDIITNLHELGDDSLTLTKKYVSANNGVIIVNGRANLIFGTEGILDVSIGETVVGKFGTPIPWTKITNEAGAIINGTSKIYLEQPLGGYVVGTVSTDPLDENVLLFNVDEDTIPTNTISPINKIVDPIAVGPEDGLPMKAAGQRYLLTQATGSIYNGALVDENGVIIVDVDGNPLFADPNVGAKAWSSSGKYLIADANDIVEFDGTHWNVVFDASEVNTVHYVTNLTSNIQYKWTGTEWVKSWEGYYPEGTWNLVIE